MTAQSVTLRGYLGKLYARFPLPLSGRELAAARTGPRVLANSMPKAGTNLLLRVMHLLPSLAPRWRFHVNNETPEAIRRVRQMRRGTFVSAHLYWSRELEDTLHTRDIRQVFIVRDPRDIVVSTVPYITRIQPHHRLSPYLRGLPDDAARISAIICGIDGTLLPDGRRSRPIGEHLQLYMPWVESPHCLTVRFEDLIGAAGGGSDERQLAAVRSIVRHLGEHLSDEQVRAIATATFHDGARTFRKGQIGDWRTQFTDAHRWQFKESLAGEALLRLGFEQDQSW